MSPDSVTVTTGIDASVEVVWRFLTTGRAAWWPEMRFEAVVGAPLIETWIDDGREASATGCITRCDEPQLLGFNWTEHGWDHPLDVLIELVMHGQSTSVTLTESGLPRSDSLLIACGTRAGVAIPPDAFEADERG